MVGISLTRLYALRLAYLILGGGLIAVKWPLLVGHGLDWPLYEGVTASLLGAMALLAILGLRYPLQMLPLLLFEVLWKFIWAVFVWLPLYLANGIDDATAALAVNCLVVVILIPLIPWDYVITRYVREPGAPWRRNSA